MLRLQCTKNAKASLQSRVAVLKVDHPAYDFALAAGHALPADRPCKVLDFSGGHAKVDIIRLSSKYAPGTQTDWAIARFPKMENTSLLRYALRPVLDPESLEGTEVQFADAFGLPENGQNCRLSIFEFRGGTSRIVHDCRGIPGQSGSPVTQVIEGENRLIGLNMGKLWMIESPKTGRPDRKGYIAVLDRNMVVEIQTLIDEMS